jgi:hypothetical protein
LCTTKQQTAKEKIRVGGREEGRGRGEKREEEIVRPGLTNK